MTLVPAVVILVARGADRVARRDGLRLPGRDASRRRRDLDRDPAPRARRRDRRPGRDQLGLGAPDRDRADRARRDGDEGRGDAVACLAAACASDRAGAGVGADERRDDQGRDLRARAGARRLARVLPVWFGVLVLALGALSAVGGVVYALFQHELKRLLAFHSVENIGIIVLGIGACLRPAHARRRSCGRRSRSRRRSSTR